MSDSVDRELLLGKVTPSAQHYAPELLYPIPRKQARTAQGIPAELPFYGVDVWHAYELSWLDGQGRPQACVGRFTIPIKSPNLVESKSFKLYLNSLNSERFEDSDSLIDRIQRDVSAVAGAAVELDILALNDPGLVGVSLPGTCIDSCDYVACDGEPSVDMLQLSNTAQSDFVEESVHSHLLRSLCPVTGQPDWASVLVTYRGKPLDRGSLLSYLIAYREHQEFHEQCVERMFCDLSERLSPQLLQIQAFYTRRGGMDINPFRSTNAQATPLGRMNRQ
ncbi:MAG: NADPH-dependent 7-cyano-7-deazaguanine reductase QueF [Halioglobus sp.]